VPSIQAEGGGAPGVVSPDEETPARTAPLARRRRLLVAAFAAGIGVLAAVIVLVVAIRPHRPPTAAEQRPSGVPSSVSTSLADLMGLSPVPVRAAPGFTLTDQYGQRLALSAFRGKVVVLEFMDPHCTDICPLVSAEFVAAYHDLGPLASKVVFAAVNVNQYHAAVRDVTLFSDEHQLTSIPDWHFFTGPLASLRAVWRGYGIVVQPRGPNADVVHTSSVYFVDLQGRERYLAAPMADYTAAGAAYLPPGQIAAWGRGIALVARSLAA
jgi:cytochrome oxidase Cu insertion factor (SCO1/SenC/PrrC family)